jgi:hypothetical protein
MRWRSLPLAFALCVVITGGAQAQAVQVPLETTTGWGAVKAPQGYKALRVQARSTVDVFAVARIFADFANHPTMFPRVVDGVEILACDATSLKARYRTKFDPKPGGKTKVQTLTNMKVAVLDDRVEFTWSSNQVESAYVNAVWGRALFLRQRGAAGNETLIDYVSAVRPKSGPKGLLVESQKGVLADDARYVIGSLLVIALHRKNELAGAGATNIFGCD